MPTFTLAQGGGPVAELSDGEIARPQRADDVFDGECPIGPGTPGLPTHYSTRDRDYSVFLGPRDSPSTLVAHAGGPGYDAHGQSPALRQKKADVAKQTKARREAIVADKDKVKPLKRGLRISLPRSFG
jgi:hypothetical protein